ncbi:MAG: type II toxin-antitoxin system Phd/YefM family antitoxin [Terriglobales bacterium]
MKVATISQAKNNLSKLIDGLGSGPVLIFDRERPVARLEPLRPDDPLCTDQRLAGLVRRGIVEPGSKPLPKGFFEAPLPPLPRGASLVQAVLAEREEGW